MYGRPYQPALRQAFPAAPYQAAAPNPPCADCQDEIRMAIDTCQVYPVTATEILYLLNPNYFEPNLRMYTVRQAMYALRFANRSPYIGEKRSAALDRILTALRNGRNKIYRLPARYVAAILFNDLDCALFDGMLRKRVYIGNRQLPDDVLGCTSVGSARGTQIDISTKHFDEGMRGEQVGRRMAQLIEVLVHEMCHAFLPALCAPGYLISDYDADGRDRPDGHGIYFGEIMGLAQKIFDYHNAPVDLSYHGNYQLFERD